MLLSMTGSGEAHGAGPGVTIGVEVRSVNNRHLKVTVRGSEPYPHREAEIERVVRRTVRRGSVQVRVQVDREVGPTDAKLDTAALRGYFDQLRAAFPVPAVPPATQDLQPPPARPGYPGLPDPPVQVVVGSSRDPLVGFGPVMAGLLTLPGLVTTTERSGTVPDGEWPVVEKVIEQAVGRLDTTRAAEGRAMADELLGYHQHMADRLAFVREHLPAVMAGYRGRILDRVRQAVADAGVGVEPAHLVREVALFADRTDVAEEVSRFAAHLDQFAEVVQLGAEGAGRRLEFITQELGREANTLGSKAGDVSISRHVIELKATLEKVRELIQNIE